MSCFSKYSTNFFVPSQSIITMCCSELEYLETTYKGNLYDKKHVDFEFYDRISNDLIDTIPLQVSTSIFYQMEFDRWSGSVKMLEEIIEKERWL